MSLVDIVVVNWNAGEQLRECAESVIEHGEGLVGAFVVMDNGSTDGSAHRLTELPGVSVDYAGENLGFAKACNRGAAQGNSPYILFFNPDARLLPGALQTVIDYLEAPANARVGIAGIQLLEESGEVARSCARFPTPLSLIAQSAGLDRVIRRFRHFEVDWDHQSTRAVDQIIGAFLMIRRSVFEQLEGFDERFFVYFEDLDLAYRARQAGWASVFIADAQAVHTGGGVSQQVKARRLFYVLRSRVLYARKHFRPASVAAIVAATMLVEPFARSALALSRSSLTSLRETWGAYAMFAAWITRTAKEDRT